MQDLLLNDLATSMNSWTMFNTDTETLPSNPAQHIRDLQEQLAKEREANDDLQAQNRFLTARCKELHRQLSTRPCVDTVWMDSASTSWSLGGGVLGTENHVSATVSTSSASLSKGTSHSTFSVFREPEPPNHSPLNQAGVIPHPLIDTDEGDHIYQYPLEERQGDATLSKIDSPYLTPLSRPRLSYPPAQRVPSLGTSDAPKAGCRLSWASVISTPDSVQSDDTFVDTPPVSNGGKVIGLTHGYPLKASSGTVLILDMWSVHRAFMSWLTTTTLPQEERLQAAMRYRLLLTTCIQECPDKISIPKSNSHLIQGSDSNPSANPNPNRFSLLIQATPTTTCKLSTIPSLRRLFHNRFEHMDHPYLAIWTSLNQPTNPSFQTLPKAHPTIRQGSFDFTSKAYPSPRLIVLSPSSKPPSATPLKASIHLVKRALVRFSRVVIRHRKVLTHPVTLCALVRPLCGLWAPPSAQDFFAATIWGMMVTTLPDLP